MSEIMSFSNATIPITTVLNSIKNVSFGGLDLQPPYQRGYIWKDDFKDKLIYSIIKGYPTGNISVRTLQSQNEKGAKSEVVDGQQRLTTIRDFVFDDYAIKSVWSKRIIKVICDYYQTAKVEDPVVEKLSKKLSAKGNPKLNFSDLPSVIQDNINSYNIAMTYIADSSESQIREYFRFLQNQERLRAGEIINSMPATNLETFIEEITNKNKFLDIIGFVDDRAEFDKVFYSIIGLFDSKISFGTTDKAIQNYASNALTPSIGLVRTQKMVEQINLISAVDKKLLENSRKRYLKFLLLLAGLGKVDFGNDTAIKLSNLKRIDDKLAAYFSARAGIVEQEFSGFSREVIEELRYVALLTKGGHSLIRVENRMDILAYYINNNIPQIQPSGIALVEM